MLLTGLLLLLALIVAAAISIAAEGGRRGAPSVFCPEHETLVEVKANGCFALDDERRVGSVWSGCQRPCVTEAPRARAEGSPIRRVLVGAGETSHDG